MPKRTDGIPRRMLRTWISERVYDELYLLLLDPYTKRPRYGSISQINEDLWKKWIEDFKQKQQKDQEN